jgi:hypothetical protein
VEVGQGINIIFKKKVIIKESKVWIGIKKVIL